MINAGGTGLTVVRKCHSEEHPHCDMVHRPAYYGMPSWTPKQMQCLWFLTVDICACDHDLNPLDRAGQHYWRVCSLHLNNDHAKQRQGVRETLANFLGLMLRDQVGVITGDFNQGAYALGRS